MNLQSSVHPAKRSTLNCVGLAGVIDCEILTSLLILYSRPIYDATVLISPQTDLTHILDQTTRDCFGSMSDKNFWVFLQEVS